MREGRRKVNGDRRAFLLGARHADVTAQEVHHSFRDGETQSGPVMCPRPAVRLLLERLEQMRQKRLFDADSRILDAEQYARLRFRDGHAHVAFVCKLERVVDEIRQDPVAKDAVGGKHRGVVGVQVERNALLLCHRLMGGDHFGGQPSGVDIGDVEIHRPSLDLRHVQHGAQRVG